MRHIVCISGGKDSTAMALLLKKIKKLDIETIFCDTGRELPEVYTFLDNVEKILKQPIKRISFCGRDFDWYLKENNFFLPSASARWCTRLLKIIPFERFVGNKQEVVVSIGIRADEKREGNYGNKSNIHYEYPLVTNNLALKDVKDILKMYGVVLPTFYNWRTTGGCWCCPFQRINDWRGLKKFHPSLFQKSLEDEEESLRLGRNFTWRRNLRLKTLTGDWEFPVTNEDYEDEMPCLICYK